jgi:hypothetical protein
MMDVPASFGAPLRMSCSEPLSSLARSQTEKLCPRESLAQAASGGATPPLVARLRSKPVERLP